MKRLDQKMHNHSKGLIINIKLWAIISYLPVETLFVCHRHSEYQRLATGHGWRAGSLERLWSPPSLWSSRMSGCQRPSLSPREPDSQGLPKGCAASHGHPPAPGYLNRTPIRDINILQESGYYKNKLEVADMMSSKKKMKWLCILRP